MPYKNKDDKRAANRRWADANPDKVSASRSAYLDRKKAQSAALAPAKAEARAQKAKQSNAAKNLATRIHRRNQRELAIVAMGGKCQSCGFDNHDALEFDHIEPLLRRTNGMRSKDNRLDMARIIAGDHSGIQLLCANCHSIKTRQNREHLLRFEVDSLDEDSRIELQLSLFGDQ